MFHTPISPTCLLALSLGVLASACASASVDLQSSTAIQLGCEQVAAGAVRATFGTPPPPPSPSTTTQAAGAVAGVASVATTIVGAALPPVGALISIGASAATTVGTGAIHIAGLPKGTPLPDPPAYVVPVKAGCLFTRARHGILSPTLTLNPRSDDRNGSNQVDKHRRVCG
jgi:hypothetical protein